MLIFVAALLLTAADVSITVEAPTPLKLVKGELRGAISVRIKNRGAEPVTLQHRDVHGLRFTPEKGGAPSAVLHSCDCAFELGLGQQPEKRTFTLAPGAQLVLRFDDFACGGGPYRAPPAGTYQLTYQLSETAPEPWSGDLDLTECERRLVARRGPESPPLKVTVRK